MREEEKKLTSKIQRILKKRWALPAIYMSSAALILALVFIVQNSFTNTANDNTEESAETGKNFDQPAVEVNSNLEKIQMPVTDVANTVIKKQFYDVHADEKEQEAALVFYNNRYEPNKGIDIALKNGKPFDVVASISGSVTKVQEDALLGNVIEVEHEDGVMTRYQSVTDIKVAVGDEVKQGDTLATAGKSQINEEAGVHVHFEIRKDNVALNPIEFMDKQVSAIQTIPEPSNDEVQSEPSKEPAKAETSGSDTEDKTSTNKTDTTTQQPIQ